MRPTLKTYAVKYWACGYSIHRHKSKEVAERCIAKMRSARSGKRNITWTPEKREGLLRDVEGGMTYKAAGLMLGISPERVRQVIVRAQRERRRKVAA